MIKYQNLYTASKYDQWKLSLQAAAAETKSAAEYRDALGKMYSDLLTERKSLQTALDSFRKQEISAQNAWELASARDVTTTNRFNAGKQFEADKFSVSERNKLVRSRIIAGDPKKDATWNDKQASAITNDPAISNNIDSLKSAPGSRAWYQEIQNMNGWQSGLISSEEKAAFLKQQLDAQVDQGVDARTAWNSMTPEQQNILGSVSERLNPQGGVVPIEGGGEGVGAPSPLRGGLGDPRTAGLSQEEAQAYITRQQEIDEKLKQLELQILQGNSPDLISTARGLYGKYFDNSKAQVKAPAGVEQVLEQLRHKARNAGAKTQQEIDALVGQYMAALLNPKPVQRAAQDPQVQPQDPQNWEFSPDVETARAAQRQGLLQGSPLLQAHEGQSVPLDGAISAQELKADPVVTPEPRASHRPVVEQKTTPRKVRVVNEAQALVVRPKKLNRLIANDGVYKTVSSMYHQSRSGGGSLSAIKSELESVYEGDKLERALVALVAITKQQELAKRGE